MGYQKQEERESPQKASKLLQEGFSYVILKKINRNNVSIPLFLVLRYQK